jgi:hypothetical protein
LKYGYLKYTVSDAGRTYHRSQGARTVGNASFSGFSTRAGRGPGRPGCAVPTQWLRHCRSAGIRRTQREPGANSCQWRAETGYRLPGLAFPPNARHSAFWRLCRRPGSYRILAPACVRNAGGAAPSRPGRAGLSKFPTGFGPATSVGRTAPDSCRNSACLLAQVAGGAVRLRF